MDLLGRRPPMGVDRMREAAIWSVNCGRWAGIQVRVHALFLLLALATLFISSGEGQADAAAYGLLALVVLLASVVVHELGHAVAAVRLGGAAEEIVLCPWGGSGTVAGPPQPRLQVVVAMTGPLVNLGLLVTAAALLLAIDRGVDLRGLLHPLAPRGVLAGSPALVAIKLTVWANWVLFLVNLLPAPPLDAGRALRSALWPVIGYRRAVVLVAAVAKLTAIGICVVAWIARDAAPVADAAAPELAPQIPLLGLVPAWAMLLAIAFAIFFSARADLERLRQRDTSERLLGYELGEAYGVEASEVPSPQPTFLQRWLERRRQARNSRRKVIEEEEEWRVDDILARLHELGPQALSTEDRSILQRAAARYRSRRSVSEP